MAPKFFRTIIISAIVLAALAALPPTGIVAADSGVTDAAFPALGTFATLVNNGQGSQLRGVYVPNVLADGVVQQPANQTTFVSPRDGVVTQFAAASGLGATGLLAHNFLAGAKFPQMQYGQMVYLIYGDGRIAQYMVTSVQKYQALQPESPYSEFVDLATNRHMTSGEVFNVAYGHPGAVVFQTCIAQNGVPSWGRLFIVAQPYVTASSVQ